VYKTVSDNHKTQISGPTALNSITVQLMPSQTQIGGSDCGLYAIATARLSEMGLLPSSRIKIK